MRNRYCSVMVDGRLDTVTFPNPDKDETAKQQALDRAKWWRETRGRRTAYAVLIEEILDGD